MVNVKILSPEKVKVSAIGSAVRIGSADRYDGAYEATPTRETQTFSTAEKLMMEDFIVHPIPQNYGLITYSGFEILVS